MNVRYELATFSIALLRTGNRLSSKRWAATLGLCFFLVCLAPRAFSEEFVFRHENILGTSMELTVTALALDDANQAEQAALKEIDRLNAIFNTYDPDSVLSKFSRAPLNTPQFLPQELLEVLIACDWWRRRTHGAFNPLIETSSDLWKRHAEANTLPEPEAVAATLQKIVQSAWKIESSYESVQRVQDLKINLNAIAKGYIIDRASQAALSATAGVDGILLSIGGDLRCSGSVAREVGIANPAAAADNQAPVLTLTLRDYSIATSASYARGYDIQGKHYSHIIDPRSGYPVAGEVQSASVLARNAAQADALSTALMVLSPQEGIALIENLPDTECLLIIKEGRHLRSSGLNDFIYRDTDRIEKGTPWKSGYELEVAFEINNPDTSRYQRPYIAIWIEDEFGDPVKTLCLWLEPDTTYVSKLHRWNRLDHSDWNRVRTMSKATRRPGRYRLVWDGSDDDGNPLPSGKYVVLIEVVREHGTHQLMREELELREDPLERKVRGNIEIKSATLSYKKNKS